MRTNPLPRWQLDKIGVCHVSEICKNLCFTEQNMLVHTVVPNGVTLLGLFQTHLTLRQWRKGSVTLILEAESFRIAAYSFLLGRWIYSYVCWVNYPYPGHVLKHLVFVCHVGTEYVLTDFNSTNCCCVYLYPITEYVVTDPAPTIDDKSDLEWRFVAPRWPAQNTL